MCDSIDTQRGGIHLVGKRDEWRRVTYKTSLYKTTLPHRLRFQDVTVMNSDTKNWAWTGCTTLSAVLPLFLYSLSVMNNLAVEVTQEVLLELPKGPGSW